MISAVDNNNGQLMDTNGQQSAVLQASLMPFFKFSHFSQLCCGRVPAERLVYGHIKRCYRGMIGLGSLNSPRGQADGKAR